MTVVRPCANAEEMRAAFGPIWHYFGMHPPTEDRIKHFARVIEPQRVHAGFDGDQAVAGSGAFAFDLTVPGGQVKAAGITIVGVLPTHRRRGYLRGMMRSQIDAARAGGEPVALLWATEEVIYRRFGYGLASLGAEIDVPRQHAALLGPADGAIDVQLVTLGAAEPLIAPVYARVAAVTPGMFARTQAWWQDRLLVDHPWQRGNGGVLQCAVACIEGRPAAYAFYRLNQSFDRGVFAGTVFVAEAMGDTPQATRAIWRFLFSIDLAARVKAVYLPADHPLLLSAAEPRRLNFLLRDVLWVRLVEVGAALASRGYATDDSVVIEVADDFCPWNAGRWQIGRGGVEKTSDTADLACDVMALGSVYLGGFTFAQLARALHVEELRPGAIARADAMFRSERAPWCPEIF